MIKHPDVIFEIIPVGSSKQKPLLTTEITDFSNLKVFIMGGGYSDLNFGQLKSEVFIWGEGTLI